MRSFFLIPVVAAIDQITKVIVQRSVPGGTSLPVAGGLLAITHVRNPGSAFGLLRTPTVPIGMAVAVIAAWAAVVVCRKGARLAWPFELAFGMILGGTIGNLIDRVRVGHVIDFIDLGFWPVFNIADAAITIGAAMLVCAVALGRPGGRSAK